MESELWRAALPHLFRILQIALGGAACGCLWNGVYALASSGAHAQLPAFERTAAAQEPAQPADYAAISRRNLFKPLPDAKPEPVAKPVAQSRLQATLLGTVLAEPAALSMGVVRDPSTNKIVVVHIGDAIAAGQAKVVKIEHRRIVVDHGGRLEALEFVEDGPVPRSRRPRAGEPPQRAGPGALLRSGAEDRVRQAVEQRMLGRARRLNMRPAAAADAPAEPDVSADAPAPQTPDPELDSN